MEVSCDGYIECQQNLNHKSCKTIAPCSHYKWTMEIKYLSNESNLMHRYHIPIYHATQMICQMHAEKCIEGWYVLVTKITVILITLKYNKDIWNQLWNMIKETYDVIQPEKPKKIEKERIKFKEILKRYVAEESEFICEVPKVRGITSDNIFNCSVLEPFRTVYSCKPERRKFHTYVEDLNISLNEASELLDDAYNLQRRKACEIFGFIVADTDRQYSKKYPANNWIAYALKGNSLDMDITRHMIEEVHDVCKENNFKILTEDSDGQFHKCACRTIDGKPLTWLTCWKYLWSELLSKSKEDLLNILESVTYVSEESISKLSTFHPNGNDFNFEFENIKVNCFEYLDMLDM